MAAAEVREAVEHHPEVAAAYTVAGEASAMLHVRAITSDTGRVLCEGTVVHRGRTLATAQATLTAGDRLLAHGTASLLIRPPDARTASTARPASGS